MMPAAHDHPLGDVTPRIAAAFRAAGVQGWLHACFVDGQGAEVQREADRQVVLASAYKLAVLVSFCRAVDEGRLDPQARRTLQPRQRTAGPTGVAAMDDPVTMSWRDLARSMIAVSDNSAADALVDRLGLGTINRDLEELDIDGLVVRSGTAEVHRVLEEDLAGPGPFGATPSALELAMAALGDDDRPARTRAVDARLMTAGSARSLTSLLTALWTDRAASAGQCAWARAVLGQQVWPHRLAAGFDYPRVRVAGKTGTLGPFRHEVGVVDHPGETPIAIAVLTRSARADPRQPRADAVIGEVARLTVDALRSARRTGS